MAKNRPTYRGPRPNESRRGASILEFVLVMPFLFLLFALVFDGAAMLLDRQRIEVAVGQLGVRHSILISSEAYREENIFGPKRKRQEAFERVKKEIRDDILAPSVDAWKIDKKDIGALDGLGSGGGGLASAGPTAASLFGRLSGGATYTIGADLKPVFGNRLGSQPYETSIAIDGGTWTYWEVPGYFGIVKDGIKGAVGKLFEWLGL